MPDMHNIRRPQGCPLIDTDSISPHLEICTLPLYLSAPIVCRIPIFVRRISSDITRLNASVACKCDGLRASPLFTWVEHVIARSFSQQELRHGLLLWLQCVCVNILYGLVPPMGSHAAVSRSRRFHSRHGFSVAASASSHPITTSVLAVRSLSMIFQVWHLELRQSRKQNKSTYLIIASD